MALVDRLIRVVLGVVSALAVVFALSQPLMADEASDRADLDRLFLALHDAPDAAAAGALTDRIWSIWTRPADPDLALRMLDVMEARSTRSAETTLALLDALVADYPGYAEGWNQRATLHFLMGNYEASIADCGRTLELEPRHFGALAGRAMIYLQLGKRSLALRDMQAALAIHPFLVERALFPELTAPITRT